MKAVFVIRGSVPEIVEMIQFETFSIKHGFSLIMNTQGNCQPMGLLRAFFISFQHTQIGEGHFLARHLISYHSLTISDKTFGTGYYFQKFMKLKKMSFSAIRVREHVKYMMVKWTTCKTVS